MKLLATSIPVLLASAVIYAPSSQATRPSPLLRAKQARARVVLAQLNAIDRQLGAVVEGWDGARLALAQSRTELAANAASLRIARRGKRQADLRLRQRLVQIYESNQPSAIDVIVNSTSMSDLLAQLDAANAIAASDHQVAQQVTAERDRLASVQRTLQRITEKRREGLARLSASRNRITAMLQRRRALLALVKQEIRAIRVHEHRQQLILAAQARARFARERQTLARQAAVRAEAARANHARAATTTTPAPDAKPLAPSSTTATAPQQTTTDAAVAPQPTTPAALPPPAPAGPGHVDAASIALRYLGVPYRWGGASPGGFDCSGLVMYVFAQLGISLPHYAAAQYGFGTPVPRDQIQPGDLVFFDGLSHVGIAIGNGQMVHAPHTGDVVRISNISDFGAGYVGARRI